MLVHHLTLAGSACQYLIIDTGNPAVFVEKSRFASLVGFHNKVSCTFGNIKPVLSIGGQVNAKR